MVDLILQWTSKEDFGIPIKSPPLRSAPLFALFRLTLCFRFCSMFDVGAYAQKERLCIRSIELAHLLLAGNYPSFRIPVFIAGPTLVRILHTVNPRIFTCQTRPVQTRTYWHESNQHDNPEEGCAIPASGQHVQRQYLSVPQPATTEFKWKLQ